MVEGVRGIRVEHALLHFLPEIGLQGRPYCAGARGERGEEFGSAAIRSGVGDNEPPDVDLGLPLAGFETAPRIENRRHSPNRFSGIHGCPQR